jgi:SAM-dependent methyltransferase
MKFITSGDSHQHSLETLNALYEYDDFMGSIQTLVDLGCGTGEDLEWWATRTTRDDIPEPLNIQCVGVDLAEQLPIAKQRPNITYQSCDFEGTIQPPKEKFDVLWCHDAFQYCINPLQTLGNWWHIASDGAMLVIIVPRTIKLDRQRFAYTLDSGCYYHHTIVSLIYMLATAGWDCRSGFFLQHPQDSYIRVIVYKSQQAPQDPKKTTWYSLMEQGLLPESADRSVYAHGYLRQQDLILPWVDKSLMSMAKQ